jgi:tRNA U34 5-methylaminomethyl-2-thiouridine-forming methyltransferase MnmC
MDKSEAISFRVTPKKRKQIKQWAEEHGLTEADALRQMVDNTLYDQERLDEIQADEELKERLDEIEEHIRELDRSWWERIFG